MTGGRGSDSPWAHSTVAHSTVALPVRSVPRGVWPRLEPSPHPPNSLQSMPGAPLCMRPGARSCSTPSPSCIPADAPRLLIPVSGPIHWQPGSGGRRSASDGGAELPHYLPSPCFSHGQLYVAASRVGHPDHIRFAVDRDKNGERRTRNQCYANVVPTFAIGFICTCMVGGGGGYGGGSPPRLADNYCGAIIKSKINGRLFFMSYNATEMERALVER